MKTIKFKIIDNFKITGDNHELFLTINGEKVWNSSMLNKKERRELSINQAKSYDFKLQDGKKVFKQKNIDQLDGKLIKVVSRKSPSWTGLRGLMWEGIITLISGKYTLKIRKNKKNK